MKISSKIGQGVNLAVEAVATAGWEKVEFLVGPKIRHNLFTLCRVKGFQPHAAKI